MAYRLHLAFEDSGSFRTEFERNIAMGGAFLPTGDSLELRSFVDVEIELCFCNESVILEAEVVHLVPPERALNPGDAGVAVSFRKPASELREMFKSYLGAAADERLPAEENVEEQSAAGRRTAADLPMSKSRGSGHCAPQTRFEVVSDGVDSRSCSDLEVSVLELAGAGFDVARMLEIIPEDSVEVHRAVDELVDRGALKIRRPG